MKDENSKIEKEIVDAATITVPKSETTNKRIEFDSKTMKKLEIMLPLYKEEIDEKIKDSELYSYVVRVAINALFDGDFKKKLDEL